jgi:predicted  nucleic acid-binding Zn-ribbon protein
VEQARAELDRVQEQVARQREEYDRQIEQLQQERDQLRSQLDPALLTAYDRIASRHPRDALAEVRGRVCGGCHTQITKQTQVLLMRENKIVYCHSCGRMLMLAD